jgi:hypothetical protein
MEVQCVTVGVCVVLFLALVALYLDARGKRKVGAALDALTRRVNGIDSAVQAQSSAIGSCGTDLAALGGRLDQRADDVARVLEEHATGINGLRAVVGQLQETSREHGARLFPVAVDVDAPEPPPPTSAGELRTRAEADADARSEARRRLLAMSDEELGAAVGEAIRLRENAPMSPEEKEAEDRALARFFAARAAEAAPPPETTPIASGQRAARLHKPPVPIRTRGADDGDRSAGEHPAFPSPRLPVPPAPPPPIGEDTVVSLVSPVSIDGFMRESKAALTMARGMVGAERDARVTRELKDLDTLLAMNPGHPRLVAMARLWKQTFPPSPEDASGRPSDPSDAAKRTQVLSRLDLAAALKEPRRFGLADMLKAERGKAPPPGAYVPVPGAEVGDVSTVDASTVAGVEVEGDLDVVDDEGWLTLEGERPDGAPLSDVPGEPGDDEDTRATFTGKAPPIDPDVDREFGALTERAVDAGNDVQHCRSALCESKGSARGRCPCLCDPCGILCARWERAERTVAGRRRG